MSPQTARLFPRLLLVLAVAAAGTFGLGWVWIALLHGPAMSIHGWVALTLGLLGIVGLTWVLMALAFKSSREGWDDRADNALEPGPEDREEH